jgi:predicted ABC-type ATPase
LKPNLYIIAGCNGAGKTTASFEILPNVFDCREFVNADSIAVGISPFQPEKVAIEAGKLMLQRIEYLLSIKSDFAIETTLSSKNYLKLIEKAHSFDYKITLLFFYLNSVELAKERVKSRVEKGGHSIPENVIERRYSRGIENLKIYIEQCDDCFVYDNSDALSKLIFRKKKLKETIFIEEIWINISKLMN